MSHPSNNWDGISPMVTTHRTDEMEIIRAVAALRGENELIPSWVGSNSQGWRPARSEHWNEGAKRICERYDLTPLVFCWFADRASELM